MAYFDLTITRIPIGLDLNEHGDGCFPLASEEELQAMRSSGLPWIKITDNGINGDGLEISLHRKSEDDCFASFRVPDESLGTLIESLMAVKKLRESQG